LSTSEYFKWAAYDDIHSPDFLERCVRVLEANPSVILCYSKTGRIDEDGRFLGNYDQKDFYETASWKTQERFGDLISMGYPKGMVYGVGRAASLKKTRLFGSYIGADRNFMAEIGLVGRAVMIPKFLFFRRDHPAAYTSRFCQSKFATSLNLADQSAVWSKDNWTNFPNWRDCIEFFRSVRYVHLKWSEKFMCYLEILRWFMKEGWQFMGDDVEKLLLRRSSLAKRILPFCKFVLRRVIFIFVKIKQRFFA
jgi:hypothetical protein